jgi:hypothetical protein
MDMHEDNNNEFCQVLQFLIAKKKDEILALQLHLKNILSQRIPTTPAPINCNILIDHDFPIGLKLDIDDLLLSMESATFSNEVQPRDSMTINEDCIIMQDEQHVVTDTTTEKQVKHESARKRKRMNENRKQISSLYNPDGTTRKMYTYTYSSSKNKKQKIH